MIKLKKKKEKEREIKNRISTSLGNMRWELALTKQIRNIRIELSTSSKAAFAVCMPLWADLEAKENKPVIYRSVCLAKISGVYHSAWASS